MAFPPPTHPYIVGALENGPATLNLLLQRYSVSNPIWDFRPQRDRFTLREMIAHVADWNPIYLARLNRTLKEEHPFLPNCDEGQLAIERNYAVTDPHESLERYRNTRRDIIELVQSTEEHKWNRTAFRENVGDMNFGELVCLLGLHDAYHVRQVLEYSEIWDASAV